MKSRFAPLCLVVVCFLHAAAMAQEDSDKQTEHSVSVLCVDADGKPVEGAETYLFQNFAEGDNVRYRASGPVKSDAAGKASFPQAIFFDALGNFDRWVYARVPGKQVGVARSARWISQRSIINPEARVQLMPSRSVAGKVAVPAGFDPTKVTVLVRVMHITTGDGDFDYQSFPRELTFRGLDTSLPEIFECRPDAEGGIKFDDVPVGGHLYLVTVGAGLGEAQWSNVLKGRTFGEPIDLSIKEEKKLFGRVLSPEGEPVAGAEVSARIASSNVMYLSTFRSATDKEGKFSIAGLPDVEFTVYVRDPEARWVIAPREGVRGGAAPGEELTFKLENPVIVSGTVRDPDGNPVEAAAISALTDTPAGAGLDGAATDRQGQYRLRVPAGKAKLYFNALPDGFQYPNPQIVANLEILPEEKAVENLDFTLQRQEKGEE